MTLPNDIDTGVASLPATRPTVFTPPAWYAPTVEQTNLPGVAATAVSGSNINRPLAAGDTGSGNVQAAPIPNTFDPIPLNPVVASPGY